jgi:hypothetical protein
MAQYITSPECEAAAHSEAAKQHCGTSERVRADTMPYDYCPEKGPINRRVAAIAVLAPRDNNNNNNNKTNVARTCNMTHRSP